MIIEKERDHPQKQYSHNKAGRFVMAAVKIVWYSFISLQTYGILYTGSVIKDIQFFLIDLMLFVSFLRTTGPAGGHIFF